MDGRGYRAEIPFEQGAREIVAWDDEDPARQRADVRLDALTDKLVDTYRFARWGAVLSARVRTER